MYGMYFSHWMKCISLACAPDLYHCKESKPDSQNTCILYLNPVELKLRLRIDMPACLIDLNLDFLSEQLHLISQPSGIEIQPSMLCLLNSQGWWCWVCFFEEQETTCVCVFLTLMIEVSCVTVFDDRAVSHSCDVFHFHFNLNLASLLVKLDRDGDNALRQEGYVRNAWPVGGWYLGQCSRWEKTYMQNLI